jgi:hypothetical protein
MMHVRKVHRVAGVRCFSSEFKGFFGFDEQLETMKIKHDVNTDFDNRKMQKIAILVTSLRKYFPEASV